MAVGSPSAWHQVPTGTEQVIPVFGTLSWYKWYTMHSTSKPCLKLFHAVGQTFVFQIMGWLPLGLCTVDVAVCTQTDLHDKTLIRRLHTHLI